MVVGGWICTGHRRFIRRNGAAFAPGMVGNAFSLDGVDDYVILPSTNALYNPVTGFSWDAWVQLASVDWEAVLLVQDPIGCEDYGLVIGGFAELGIPPDSLAAGVDPLGGCEARQFFFGPFPGGIVPDAWYHIALTVDHPNSVAKLYANGQTVASITLTGPVNARNMAVTIGASRHEGEEPTWNHFHGRIDELHVFDRPLSAAEINAIYEAGSAGIVKPSR